MLSLKGFSQIDTTKIVLSSKVAREVVKDLTRYDNLKNISKFQDSLINTKDNEILVLRDLNTLSDKIILNQQNIINKLSKKSFKLDIRIGSNITNRFELYNMVRLNYNKFYIGSYLSVNNYNTYLSYNLGLNIEYKIF
jgi:hypothetical protein